MQAGAPKNEPYSDYYIQLNIENNATQKQTAENGNFRGRAKAQRLEIMKRQGRQGGIYGSTAQFTGNQF